MKPAHRRGAAGILLGGTADVAVPLLVPADPGTYRGYWQIEAPDGTRFGDRAYLVIVVR
jgi:hypothetical protein